MVYVYMFVYGYMLYYIYECAYIVMYKLPCLWLVSDKCVWHAHNNVVNMETGLGTDTYVSDDVR